jgi:hypothetical protein
MAATTACRACRAPITTDMQQCPKCGAPFRPLRQPLTVLGIVGFSLGCCAFLVAWIPLVGIISLPLSFSGLILTVIAGIMCLTGHRSGIGWPIGGIVVNTVAITAVVVMTAIPAAGVVAAVQHTAAPKPTAAQPLAYHRHDEAVPSGEAVVSIISTSVAPVIIHDRLTGDRPSAKAHLQIRVKITNTSQVHRLQCSSWVPDLTFESDRTAVCMDEHGNNYRRITFAMDRPVGNHGEAFTVEPGTEATDLLTFEAPIAAAQTMMLELPAANIKGPGVIRFQIPRSSFAAPAAP